MQVLQHAVDRRLKGTSSWLRVAREKAAQHLRTHP
jgi:hypothetical protein